MVEGEAVRFGVSPSEAWRFTALVELGSNYAPPAAARQWLEKIGVSVPGTAEPPDYPDDGVAPAIRKAVLAGPAGIMTPAMQQAALLAIHRGAAGAPLSDSGRAQDRAAVPVMAAAIAPHLASMTDAQRVLVAKTLLDDALKQGWVRIDPAARIPKANGKGSDARRGLVVEWGTTPWPTPTATTATLPQRDEVVPVSTCGPSLEGHRNVVLGGVGDDAVQVSRPTQTID